MAGWAGWWWLAVTLHNLPEGMVVGLAAALALRGEPEAVSGALALALGIGLQNIPEGAAVSLPLAQAGQGRRKAFCAGAASGLVEPLGALLALALAGWVSAALPWLMSAAAGCMVCVTAQEMIPEAVEQDEPAGVISVVLGVRPHDGAGYCAVAKKAMQLHRLFLLSVLFLRGRPSWREMRTPRRRPSSRP